MNNIDKTGNLLIDENLKIILRLDDDVATDQSIPTLKCTTRIS